MSNATLRRIASYKSKAEARISAKNKANAASYSASTSSSSSGSSSSGGGSSGGGSSSRVIVTPVPPPPTQQELDRDAAIQLAFSNPNVRKAGVYDVSAGIGNPIRQGTATISSNRNTISFTPYSPPPSSTIRYYEPIKTTAPQVVVSNFSSTATKKEKTKTRLFGFSQAPSSAPYLRRAPSSSGGRPVGTQEWTINNKMKDLWGESSIKKVYRPKQLQEVKGPLMKNLGKFKNKKLGFGGL